MTTRRVFRWAAALAVVAAVWSGLVTPARAQTPASLPALTAPVNDLAGVIDRASAAEMDARIRALEAATGDAVIVAAVPTFAPYGSIEEFAVRLFERAGIGAKGKDNGVLILVAVNDRRARIEVGYGLEGAIPDGAAGDIIRQAMLPAFRRQAYGEGLADATARVIERIARERNIAVPSPQGVERAPRRERRGGNDLARLIFIIIVILVVLGGGGGGLMSFLLGQAIGGAMRGGRHSRGNWSGWHGGFGGGGFGGGGFGGGFGGFGGGRSGGGGASGGW